MKLFLPISKEEPLARFRARLDDPMKRWNISKSDCEQRELWDQHMAADEDARSHSTTAAAPWYIIPSNRKWFRDLAVAEIVTATLNDLAIALPQPTVDLDHIRRRYHSAERS